MGSLLELIEKDPQMVDKMQENPELFLDLLPLDVQQTLLDEVQGNPQLVDDMIQLVQKIVMRVIEEHPMALLKAMDNPLRLFHKAKTPWGIRKLIKKMEEDPTMLLKEEYRGDPQLFVVKLLQTNPHVRMTVLETVAKENPKMLPLLSIILGAPTGDAPCAMITEDDLAAREKAKKLKLNRNLPKNFRRKMLKSVTSQVSKRVLKTSSSSSSSSSSSLPLPTNNKATEQLEEQRQELQKQMEELSKFLRSTDGREWQSQRVAGYVPPDLNADGSIVPKIVELPETETDPSLAPAPESDTPKRSKKKKGSSSSSSSSKKKSSKSKKEKTLDLQVVDPD